MAAVLIEVADAVTAELQTAVDSNEFAGLQFVPERSYAVWDEELADLDCLHVDVVPVNYEQTDLDARESVGYVVSVDVVIRQKFSQEKRVQSGKIDPEEIDRLVLFVEELHEYLCKLRLTDYDEAIWRETAIRSAYSREHLRTMGMFLGIVRVSFDVSERL
jgi:hypothetical protein